MDEASSMYVANRDVAGMVEILRHVDAVFTFYYALLHVWLVLGSGTVQARALSALFAIGTLPVVFAIARRLVSREAAFLGTLALGTSYGFLRYAVEARPYSLEILLCALSAWCFVELLAEPRRRIFAAYACTTVLAIYAHPLAILWTLAQAVSLAFVPRSRGLFQGFAVVAVAVAVGLVPLIAGVHLNGTHQIDWIAPMTFRSVLQFFTVLAAGDGGGPYGFGELALAIAAGAIAGAVLLFRSPRRPSGLVLSSWLLVPLAAMLILSIWKPVDESRYLCYVILPAFMLMGVTLDALRRSVGRVACVAALIVLAVGGVWQMFVYRGEDWRAAATFLDRVATADGVIVYTSNAERPLEYALRERGVPMHGTLLYPALKQWRGDTRLQPVPSTLPALAAKTYPRLWVVLSHRPKAWQPVVLTPLGRFYDDVSTAHLGKFIEIHELQRRPEATFSRSYGGGSTEK